ncbi:MAG: hypothetical protein Q8P80_01520 [Candidatus Levybacteria bacterium]|nr:hypothetical protein [Candidatus Levybacteria bacterium]
MLNLPNVKSFERFYPQNAGVKNLLIFLLVIFIAGAGTSFIFSQKTKVSEEIKKTLSPKEKPSSILGLPHTLVFGVWGENNSLIKAYDMSKDKEYLLATLPKNIKKVTVLSSNELLYINNTDEKDHGKEIVVYSLSSKQPRVVITAQGGFGIDDYVVSKNKRYLSDWEVSFLGGSNALRGGRSQVYSIDISNPQAKNLIYDELANTPVHYPLGITDLGDIYLDTFLPNSGAGWAYGMSVSNFNGSSKQNLANMQNGTYATQPDLSPDEKFLVFAGYDQNLGRGDEEKDDFRQAILTPNTIELLDVNTKNRIKLPNIPNTNIYNAAFWDKEKNILIFSLFSKNKNANGWYAYDFVSYKTQKIELKGSEKKNYSFVSFLKDNKILAAQQDSSPSTLGNLGGGYSPLVRQFLVSDGSSFAPITPADNFMQFIDLAPPSFFQEMFVEDTSGKRSLQLETFSFKPSLAPKRLAQQSQKKYVNPLGTSTTCKNAATARCLTQNPNLKRESPELDACVADLLETWDPWKDPCPSSPLYFYGQSGTKVHVNIKTPVLFSNIENLAQNYDVVLLENGKIQINNKIYKNIDFDYVSAKEITRPAFGNAVSKEDFPKIISYYAKSLGLNQKETDDLIKKTKDVLDSPFVLVSFFDEKTSKEILPISFTPNPDTYQNVVFYFKKLNSLPKTPPKEPVFPKIQERGKVSFVEVSFILDE